MLQLCAIFTLKYVLKKVFCSINVKFMLQKLSALLLYKGLGAYSFFEKYLCAVLDFNKFHSV